MCGKERCLWATGAGVGLGRAEGSDKFPFEVGYFRLFGSEEAPAVGSCLPQHLCVLLQARRKQSWDLFSCCVGSPRALEFGTTTVQSFSSFTFQSALGLETFHKLSLKMKPNIPIKQVSSPVANPM